MPHSYPNNRPTLPSHPFYTSKCLDPTKQARIVSWRDTASMSSGTQSAPASLDGSTPSGQTTKRSDSSGTVPNPKSKSSKAREGNGPTECGRATGTSGHSPRPTLKSYYSSKKNAAKHFNSGSGSGPAPPPRSPSAHIRTAQGAQAAPPAIPRIAGARDPISQN